MRLIVIWSHLIFESIFRFSISFTYARCNVLIRMRFRRDRHARIVTSRTRAHTRAHASSRRMSCIVTSSRRMSRTRACTRRHVECRASSRRHVVTSNVAHARVYASSRRMSCIVTSSRRMSRACTRVRVYACTRRHVVTSSRRHVVTSSRRHVVTSSRRHVVTSSRRHVVRTRTRTRVCAHHFAHVKLTCARACASHAYDHTCARVSN